MCISSLHGEISILLSVVLEHLVLETTLLLEFYHQLALVIRGFCWHHVVVVTSSNMKSMTCLPGAVFVALVQFLGHVLAEDLLALFAGKDNFGALHDFVVLGLQVALRTVEPLLAAAGADLHLGV